MMDVKSLLIGSVVGLVIVGIPAGLIYSNLNGKLTDAQDEKTKLTTELEEAQEQIAEYKSTIGKNQEEIAERVREIKRLQSNVGTVGTCLTGVLSAFEAISNDDPPQAVYLLGQVDKDCQRSGDILEEIEKFEASSNESYPDSLESITTSD